MRRRGQRTPIRLVVDPVACDAVGLCAHLAPDTVALDRWGYPIVPDGSIPGGQEAAARQAVRACPRRALGLVGAPGPGPGPERRAEPT